MTPHHGSLINALMLIKPMTINTFQFQYEHYTFMHKARKK